MEMCQYESVSSDVQNDIKETNDKMPFIRQFTIGTAVWSTFFMAGLCMGAPTVIIPQLRREANSTEAVTEEMASWLSAASSTGALLFDILIPISASVFGRKHTNVWISIVALLDLTFLYCSSSVAGLFVGLVCTGSIHSAASSITILVLTEYTSPKYRGAFLATKSASYFWGIWVSNAIGTFFHWKYIFAVCILTSISTLVFVTISPESPYWLAYKGDVVQCATTFRQLRGTDEDSERELQVLLKSMKDKGRQKKISTKYIRIFLQSCMLKEFYKPILLGYLLVFMFSYTGKFICMIYAIDIIKKITDSEHTAYVGMLILDGITVVGTYIGCVLSRYVKRRILLFSCSIISVFFLFVLSLYLYLIKLNIITENPYVSISILVAFSLAISCGPMILSSSIRGELLPQKNRSLAIILIALAADFGGGILIKTFPYLNSVLDLHGSFIFFGVITSLCVLVLYKYLPETKDKTLPEIVSLMRGDYESINKRDTLIR